MNIGIYKGEFQYDVVNYFADELGQGLTKLGHNIYNLDLSTMSEMDILDFLLRNPIDLVLSFNGINHNKQYVFEWLNISLGIIFVDHPFYHLSRIKEFKGNTTFFCMYDMGFLRCFEECIDKDTPIAWLLHGGTEGLLTERKIEKKHDIIFPSSIDDYEQFEKELVEMEPGIFKDTASNLYEKGKLNYNIPLYTYFKEEIKRLGISMDDVREDEEYLRVFGYIYILVDKILRARNRYKVMERLLKTGISVQHYGILHKRELMNYKNLEVNGMIDYMQLLKEIKRSRLLIHDTPYFENGSHERVLSSMLNKTLVLSNINTYCNNQYIDGESIVFYDMNDLSTLAEKTHFYLENEEDRIRIEQNAYDITKRFHTWEHRAKEILDIYYAFIEMKKNKGQ